MISIQSQPDTISRIKEFLENLRYLSSLPEGSQVATDRIEAATPLSIIPVVSVINRKKLQCIDREINESLLKVIHFPAQKDVSDGSELKRSQVPVIHFHFNGKNKQEMSNKLNLLHTIFLNLLRINIITDKRFLELITDNTFGFVLGEMIDNIDEHSNAQNIYLFAQYDAKVDYCEVCLSDDGVGLLGSLKDAGREVLDSNDAMRKILESGLSAKTEHGDIKRGTGIRYTRLAITNKELNGEFLLMSGDAVFLHTAADGEIFINFKDYFWQGTIVMIKLYKPVSKFNLYKYVR